MKEVVSFDEVVLAAEESQLYGKLIEQLNKDLLLANVALDFDKDVLPTSLKLLLQERIFELIQHRFMDYLNLLYIVDVPEHSIKDLDGHDILELSENVTFLILKREWQKVYYKNHFSSQ